MMATPIEDIWCELEGVGSFPAHRRVSAQHPLDLYAEVKNHGTVGLLTLCDDEPPMPPTYDSVAVEIGRRADSRWAVQIRLVRPELRTVFAKLCDDIVVSGNAWTKVSRAGHFVLERLARWRKLLDLGPDGLMSDQALRGLVAELSFLKDAIPRFGAVASVEAWNGPFDAPQDFDFPSGKYEIKAILPAAPMVRISSIDQLDIAAAKIVLVVYELRRVDFESPGSFTVDALIHDLRLSLALVAHALMEFEVRLLSAGYQENDAYRTVAFKFVDVRYYEVTGTFPKLARSELASGIGAATYDLVLAKCDEFRIAPLGRT